MSHNVKKRKLENEIEYNENKNEYEVNDIIKILSFYNNNILLLNKKMEIIQTEIKDLKQFKKDILSSLNKLNKNINNLNNKKQNDSINDIQTDTEILKNEFENILRNSNKKSINKNDSIYNYIN